MPAMLEAVKGFAGGYQFIVAGAPGISPDFYRVYETGFPNVKVLFGQTYRILAQSEVALVTSGTATLETALLNVPQVVCYRTLFPRLSYLGFKMILHTPFISLVNLIMGREVVKELFAKSFSVDNIRKELHRLLHVQGYRNNMLESYRELRSKLGEQEHLNELLQLLQPFAYIEFLEYPFYYRHSTYFVSPFSFA